MERSAGSVRAQAGLTCSPQAAGLRKATLSCASEESSSDSSQEDGEQDTYFMIKRTKARQQPIAEAEENAYHKAPVLVGGAAPGVSGPSQAALLFGLTAEQAKQQADDEEQVVDLSRVINDVFEYHGVTDLLHFFIYFLIASLALFMHWGSRSPLVKADVQASFTGFGGISSTSAIYGGVANIDNIDNFGDFGRYITGYLQYHVAGSEARTLPDNAMYINEYGLVQYARISAQLLPGCTSVTSACGRAAASILANSSFSWAALEALPSAPFGSGVYASVVSPEAGNRSSMLGKLNNLDVVLAALVQHVQYLSIDMLIVDAQLTTVRGDDHFWVSFEATRDDQKLVSLTSITLAARDSLYAATRDLVRAAFEVVYVALTLLYAVQEVNQLGLAMRQHGKGNGARRYAKSYWNRIDVVSILYSLGWMAWYGGFILLSERPRLDKQQLTAVEAAQAYTLAVRYNTWLYAGILANALVGLRVLKYMKLHASLRIYSSLLANAWRLIKDFLWFFLYVLLLLGSCILAYFQISGGNTRFVTVQDALNSMALLTFGFMDYDTFRARGLGLGTWLPTLIVLFWVTTMLLIVISQNIVLAIVAEAYEEAKEAEGEVEATIVKLMLYRAKFELQLLWSRLRFRGKQDFVDRMVDAYHHKLASMGPLGMSGQAGMNGKAFGEWIYARWAVALLPEARCLRNFFLDFANNKVRAMSLWPASVYGTSVYSPRYHCSKSRPGPAGQGGHAGGQHADRSPSTAASDAIPGESVGAKHTGAGAYRSNDAVGAALGNGFLLNATADGSKGEGSGKRGFRLPFWKRKTNSQAAEDGKAAPGGARVVPLPEAMSGQVGDAAEAGVVGSKGAVSEGKERWLHSDAAVERSAPHDWRHAPVHLQLHQQHQQQEAGSAPPPPSYRPQHAVQQQVHRGSPNRDAYQLSQLAGAAGSSSGSYASPPWVSSAQASPLSVGYGSPMGLPNNQTYASSPFHVLTTALAGPIAEADEQGSGGIGNGSGSGMARGSGEAELTSAAAPGGDGAVDRRERKGRHGGHRRRRDKGVDASQPQVPLEGDAAETGESSVVGTHTSIPDHSMQTQALTLSHTQVEGFDQGEAQGGQDAPVHAMPTVQSTWMSPNAAHPTLGVSRQGSKSSVSMKGANAEASAAHARKVYELMRVASPLSRSQASVYLAEGWAAAGHADLALASVDLTRPVGQRELQALMEEHIPSSTVFAAARHVLWRTRISVSAMEESSMESAARLIWMVYATTGSGTGRPAASGIGHPINKGLGGSGRKRAMGGGWLNRVRNRVINNVYELQDDVAALRAEQQQLLTQVKDMKRLLQSAVMPALLAGTGTGAIPATVAQQQQPWLRSSAANNNVVQSFSFANDGMPTPMLKSMPVLDVDASPFQGPGMTDGPGVPAAAAVPAQANPPRIQHRRHRSAVESVGGNMPYDTNDAIAISPAASSTQVVRPEMNTVHSGARASDLRFGVGDASDPRVSDGSMLPGNTSSVGAEGGERERRARRKKPPRETPAAEGGH